MSDFESFFLAVTDRNWTSSDASLQRLSNELLSPITALYVVRAPWCSAFLTALTGVLNSHVSTSKSKLHALSCLSLLANRITLPLLTAETAAGGKVPVSVSVSEVISFRRELLLPAVLELQEATEEWLVDKEEASRQLGTSLGRQHEQILTLLLRATNTDCQWAITCGTSGNQQQLLVDLSFSDRAKVQGSFLSLYTVLREFCNGRVPFLLGLLIGIAKVQSVDMLMLETVTRLLYDLSIPTSYFDPEATATSSEVDIGVFQGRVNELQSSCISLNMVETIVNRLADREPGDGSKNVGEKIVWGQAVTNITKFVLNVLEFSTTSKTIQNQWIQTVLPLQLGKKTSSAVAAAAPPRTSLVTTLMPLLLRNAVATTTSAPSQANQVYWALKLVASVFFDPVSSQSSAITTLLHSNESMTDFDVPYFCGEQQGGSDVSTPLYDAVHALLSGGVSEYVVAQVKLFATGSAQAPSQPQLRRLLLTTLRAFINVNHSGDNAKTLVNRVVSEAHEQHKNSSNVDTHGALRQVIAEVYGDLMAAMEDLATNSEAYFDIVQVHIWNLLTGSTRKVTSDSMAASLNGDISGCFGDLVQYDIPNPLAMTDEEIDTITMQIDQEIHAMERDISDLGNMMQDVRSSSTVEISSPIPSEGKHTPTSTTTPSANLSSLTGAPQLATPSRAKKSTNNSNNRPNIDVGAEHQQNSSNLRRAKRQDASVPKELCCMWTGILMREPVKVPGGASGGYHWFDLASLEAVSKEVGSVNPLTGESLPDSIADGISAGGDAIVDISLQKKITKYKMLRAKTLN